jgi:PST family polysaccharide transporter
MTEPAEQRGTAEAVTQRAVRAVKWSALAEVLVRAVQPAMLLVLARVLTPEDFGVVGVATVAVGLAQIFLEFGVGKALVQTEDAVEAHANNGFWINAALGLALYGAVALGADTIAGFFQSPRSAEVLRVLGLQIVLASVAAVPLALLQREVRFRALFGVRLLPTLLTGGLAIGLALAGHGVWALVWGTLAGAAAQVVLAWRACAWRPRAEFRRAEFARMFAFSKWVLAESALAWLISWGDAIALGHFLGPEALGFYRMGSVVVAFLSNVFFTPLVPVALSALARLQHDAAGFVAALGKLTQMVVLLALPVGAGAAAVGGLAAEAVLGPTWAGAGIVIQLMGLRMGLEWLVGLNSTALAARGRPDLNVKLLVIAAVIAVPVYVGCAPLGLVAFCWARLASAQVINAIAYGLTRPVLGLPAGFLWTRVRAPAAAALVMAAGVWALQRAGVTVGLPGLALAVAAGAALYAAVLAVLDRPTLAWGVATARRLWARDGAAVAGA